MMIAYAFDGDYDRDLQVRVAQLIARRSARGWELAAEALRDRPGAPRQLTLDQAIVQALGEPDLDWAADELDLLIAGMWIPDENEIARPAEKE